MPPAPSNAAPSSAAPSRAGPSNAAPSLAAPSLAAPSLAAPPAPRPSLPAPLFHPLPTAAVAALRAGGTDAYGLAPERRVSDGAGVPCRHCLRPVPAGRDYLIVAHRPFAGLNPYTETGPIFLCADPCAAPAPSAAIPAILASPAYILRGYDAAERIVYGTGAVVPTGEIPGRAAALFADLRVAFADVRSAANNCFQVRLRRAG